MITVNISTNNDRKTVITDIAETPMSVFEEAGIDISRSFVNITGRLLSATDLTATLEDLGIADGSTCSLTALIKMDGAR